MIRKPIRPTSVTVFAIIQIIFGGLGVLGGLATAVMFAVGTPKQTIYVTKTVNSPTGSKTTTGMVVLDQEQELRDRVAYYTAYKWTSGSIGLLVAVLQLASGLGMLGLQPWARRASLIWAVSYILIAIVSVVYSAVFLIPAYNAIADKWDLDYGPNPQISALTFTLRMTSYAVVIGVLIFLIYPALLLYFMTRRKVLDAFAGIDSRGDDQDDRGRDRYDDRDRDRARDRDRYDDRDRDRNDDRFRERPTDRTWNRDRPEDRS